MLWSTIHLMSMAKCPARFVELSQDLQLPQLSSCPFTLIWDIWGHPGLFLSERLMLMKTKAPFPAGWPHLTSSHSRSSASRSTWCCQVGCSSKPALFPGTSMDAKRHRNVNHLEFPNLEPLGSSSIFIKGNVGFPQLDCSFYGFWLWMIRLGHALGNA